MWISFEYPNKARKFINLDNITDIDIDVNKQKIVFYSDRKEVWWIHKEDFPQVYDLVKDFLDYHLEHYRIN